MSADFVKDHYYPLRTYDSDKNQENLYYLFFKRIMDVILSFAGIIILTPFFIIISVLIKIDSKGSIFYTQYRVGKNFKNFKIIKFRTMINMPGNNITSEDDERITRIGRHLRKLKIDELPQLINVLIGDMSLVGPRPEIPKYVDECILYKKVLTVKPGITDYASIKYKNEEELLYHAKKKGMDMYQYYKYIILFDKIEMNLKYIKDRSLFIDIMIILKTILCLRKG